MWLLAQSDVGYEYFEDRMVARCKVPFKKVVQISMPC